MPDPNALPSWRDGAVRSSLLDFLERAHEIPPDRRVAVFDNDGTLWCEKPNYPQVDFFVAELRSSVAATPSLASREEYAALLSGDWAAIGEMGLPRVAYALMELFVGLSPEEFDERVRRFVRSATHPLGMPYTAITYQPMLELMDQLRAHDFDVFIVSGGGTEFVRAVSYQLYGVKPEGVVGTLVEYEFAHRDGLPVLLRTGRLLGDANEGSAKVSNIQVHLGRRPVFAAGNSAGDREMLEYAAAGKGFALLVDHDDADREYAYASVAGTFTAGEPITDTARRLGWTVASMTRDWDAVFATAPRQTSTG